MASSQVKLQRFAVNFGGPSTSTILKRPSLTYLTYSCSTIPKHAWWVL